MKAEIESRTENNQIYPGGLKRTNLTVACVMQRARGWLGPALS